MHTLPYNWNLNVILHYNIMRVSSVHALRGRDKFNNNNNNNIPNIIIYFVNVHDLAYIGMRQCGSPPSRTYGVALYISAGMSRSL